MNFQHIRAWSTRWLFSINYKDIGTLYLLLVEKCSTFFFLHHMLFFNQTFFIFFYIILGVQNVAFCSGIEDSGNIYYLDENFFPNDVMVPYERTLNRFQEFGGPFDKLYFSQNLTELQKASKIFTTQIESTSSVLFYNNTEINFLQTHVMKINVEFFDGVFKFRLFELEQSNKIGKAEFNNWLIDPTILKNLEDSGKIVETFQTNVNIADNVHFKIIEELEINAPGFINWGHIFNHLSIIEENFENIGVPPVQLNDGFKNIYNPCSVLTYQENGITIPRGAFNGVGPGQLNRAL